MGQGLVSEASLTNRVNDLSGQTIQLCYHCHKCTAGCPAAFAMEYGPDRILRLIQFGQQERLLSSRDPWLCLGCEMCGAFCPNEIDINEVMIALKEIAGETGYRVQDCQELRELLADYLVQRPETVIDDRLCEGISRLDHLSQTITAEHNISGDDNSDRLIWSQNLEHIPPGLEGKKGAEIVYFVGCVASFFPRSYRVPQAFTSIMEASNADFTTLGGQEWCCGYPLLSMGRLEDAKTLIRHNVEQVKELGASRVVFACPSCYHMWKHVYPDVLEEEIGLEVLHATELMAEMIAQGAIELGEPALSLPKGMDLRVTYHDPCDLGRKSGVFEAPRQVLRSIPGLTFVEMSSYGQISECCGGGGNLESFDPDVVSEVSLHRIDRACEVDAQVIISACQQCERTLTAAVRRHEQARRARIRVMDVTELVWKAMEQ
ncbi:MAG: (Fe-S)-binding protein [Anaerolineae bacterium]|nr:(Fe-S)-binding protein [Anaerolineae bacterium]